MGSVPFWDTNAAGYAGDDYSTNPWDYMTIGGDKTPGVIEVTGSVVLAHTKSKPSGSHGARVTITGKDPQEIDATLYLWRPKQWDAWQALRKKVCGSDRLTAKAYDVYHPALADLEVKSAIVLVRSAPVRGRVAGERSIRLRLIEFFPPPATKQRARGAPATVTPGASVNEAFSSEPPSAYTPADANLSLPSGEAATVNP